MNEKPLFIPLRAEFYDAFLTGAKTTEYRRRGTRWNAETCRVGRRVILSRGYGKAHRLTGVVVGFHYDTVPAKLPGWVQCFGHQAGDAACITISLDAPGQHVLQDHAAKPALPLHRALLRRQVGVAKLLEQSQRRNLADGGFLEGGGHGKD